MAGVWNQHVRKFMQNDVTGLRKPADRGDLNQRQRLIGFPAPCSTLAQPDAEHELHLTERCRRGRILLAHRNGDRGEVVLVGDHFLISLSTSSSPTVASAMSAAPLGC